MEQEHEDQIAHIMTKMSCSKGFECIELESEEICKAKDFGIESFVQCLEENPQMCKFSFLFSDLYLCQCPLRVYFIKNKLIELI